ncbi:winged helix DNA-binding protein [Actimicrobium antarcticum]|uniref:HTH marR-type domain-containing protein n=1 Tax=Actimicrobium antarcticum TaxID=1051899 RepID=A0ABP7SXA8_9BURK
MSTNIIPDHIPSPVNSWHLAHTPLEAAATEIEWSLVRWWEAFNRYQNELLSRLSQGNLTPQEVHILHIIRMQDRPKSTSMVANLLNRDDIQNIQYSLRKLVAEKLIRKVKDGVGKSYSLAVTEKGKRFTEEIAELRRQFLIQQLGSMKDSEARLLEAARTLGLMTAMYNEAGRMSLPDMPV